jgi:imidazolonepropionase-like amidohydrolase
LAKAGVDVAVATRTSHNASMLRFALGNAVRAGLPHDAALAAATKVPAQIFGMADYGTIERNKIANLVVWTGDPFEPAHRAETVIIRGELQSTENRQTKLARRHAKRLGLIR